jgi:RNA polymerase sigma factor (sigma-70 family)
MREPMRPNQAVAPYRILARLKNNRLLSALTETWPHIASQAGFAKQLGIGPSELGRFLNMSYWPGCVHQRQGIACRRASSGQCRDGWTRTAWRIVKRLKFNYPPEWLFDEHLYGQRVHPVSIPLTERAIQQALAWQGSDPGSTPETAMVTEARRQAIQTVLNSLTPREAFILSRRFGLDDGHEWTLDDLAKELDRSRERVKQIERKALRKLQHWTRADKLRPWSEAATNADNDAANVARNEKLPSHG